MKVDTYEEMRKAKRCERNALNPDPRPATMREAARAYQDQERVRVKGRAVTERAVG